MLSPDSFPGLPGRCAPLLSTPAIRRALLPLLGGPAPGPWREATAAARAPAGDPPSGRSEVKGPFPSVGCCEPLWLLLSLLPTQNRWVVGEAGCEETSLCFPKRQESLHSLEVLQPDPEGPHTSSRGAGGGVKKKARGHIGCLCWPLPAPRREPAPERPGGATSAVPGAGAPGTHDCEATWAACRRCSAGTRQAPVGVPSRGRQAAERPEVLGFRLGQVGPWDV